MRIAATTASVEEVTRIWCAAAADERRHPLDGDGELG